MKYLLITMILFLISIPAKGQSEYIIRIDSTGKVNLPPTEFKNKGSIRIEVANNLLLVKQNEIIDGINAKWKAYLDSISGICGECRETRANLLTRLDSVNEKVWINGNLLKKATGFRMDVDDVNEPIELDVKIKNTIYSELIEQREALLRIIKVKYDCKNADLGEDSRYFSMLRELMKGNISFFECCENYTKWYASVKDKSRCSARVLRFSEIDINMLKLFFVNTLLMGRNKTQNELDAYQSELRNIDVQVKELDYLISQDRIIKTVEDVEKGEKEYTNVEVLKALLDRKNALVKRRMELNNLISKLPADQLDKNLVWYQDIWVFNGFISLKPADGKTIVRRYDFARSIQPVHKPNFPGTVYKEDQNMIISVLNIPGGKDFKFDTSQINVKVENTLFADDIDNVPGLSDMLGFVKGAWSLPSIVPKYIGGAKMSSSGSAFVAGQNEKQLTQGILFYKGDYERVEEFVRATDSAAGVNKNQKLKLRTTHILDTIERYGSEVLITELEKKEPCLKHDDCCCQKICTQMDSLCINGKYVKIPVKMLPENWVREGLCFSPCQMFNMELMYYCYEGFRSGSFEKESWRKKESTDTPLYKAMSKTYDLGPGGKHLSFYLKTKNGSESHLLEKIYVSKLYRFTAGIGVIYQNGFPYQISLNTTTNALERTYFNRIALSGGVKWYPFKTSIREPLRTGLKFRLNGTRKNYARPRVCNVHTKLSVYAGFTISKKPYEFIFLGIGFDLTPGLTIFGAHRWNWEDKVVVSGGNTFVTQGYSRYNAPGSFGFGVLIDPVIATRFFKK